MKSILFEHLEGRQFLSVTPGGPAVGAASSPAPVHASVSASLAVGAKSTEYVGTATNQDGKTSKITLVITDMKGVREGVLYVNDYSGGTTPISFTINADLKFTFKFHQPGEENTVAGKLSADGYKITATWTSLSSTGVKGHGSVEATRV